MVTWRAGRIVVATSLLAGVMGGCARTRTATTPFSVDASLVSSATVAETVGSCATFSHASGWHVASGAPGETTVFGFQPDPAPEATFTGAGDYRYPTDPKPGVAYGTVTCGPVDPSEKSASAVIGGDLTEYKVQSPAASKTFVRFSAVPTKSATPAAAYEITFAAPGKPAFTKLKVVVVTTRAACDFEFAAVSDDYGRLAPAVKAATSTLACAG
jgi:hypothetical protein